MSASDHSRKQFEVAIDSIAPGMLACVSWHEDEQRYTLLSTTNLLWKIWQLARESTSAPKE